MLKLVTFIENTELLFNVAGCLFALLLKLQLHDSLKLMIQLQQDPQEATLMKHFGITLSRIIIKFGNKQQAFHDLVTTYYFIWCSFSNFSRRFLHGSSRCSKRGARQNICIFISFPAILVQYCLQAYDPVVLLINNTQAEQPSYSQIAFHCRLIIQNKHSNMWLITIF